MANIVTRCYKMPLQSQYKGYALRVIVAEIFKEGFDLLMKREPHLRGCREPYVNSLGFTVTRDGYHRGGIIVKARDNEDEFLSTAVHESAHFAGMFLINLGAEGRELIDGEVKAVTTEWVFNCVMDCWRKYKE